MTQNVKDILNLVHQLPDEAQQRIATFILNESLQESVRFLESMKNLQKEKDKEEKVYSLFINQGCYRDSRIPAIKALRNACGNIVTDEGLRCKIGLRDAKDFVEGGKVTAAFSGSYHDVKELERTLQEFGCECSILTND